jgi:small-conductance mechanosensitive channel
MFLDNTFYHNTVKDWIVSLIIAIIVLSALRILRGIVSHRLKIFSEKTATELDDLFSDLTHRIKFFFLFSIALYSGSLVLSLPETLSEIIRKVVIIALLVQGAIWSTSIISFWIERYKKQKLEEKDAASATTFTALGFVLRLILWTIILLLALDNLGMDITALVAGLGVGGIAVALALQNILGDLLASLSIIIDKPFVIGDFIIVDEYLGTVEHVGLKTTRIRSLYGEQLIFSNNDLLGSRIRNYKRMYERRVVFPIGVVYQTPSEKLAAIPGMIREIIEAQKEARFDRSHFKNFGDFSLNFETVYWLKVPDYNIYMDTQQAINLEIFRRFEKEGIEFAYPTQTLFVNKENP